MSTRAQPRPLSRPASLPWETLLDAFPGVTAIFDRNGTIIHETPAFRGMPRTPGRTAGITSIRPFAQETFRREAERAFITEQPQVFEMGEQGPGGPIAWFRGVAKLFLDANGTPFALVHATDLTSAKQREEELARSRELLTDAQGIAHLGTWEWDLASNKIAWSDELYRIYGIDRAEYSPSFQGYLDRIHGEDRERVRETMKRALKERSSFSHDERILRPDGSIRYLHTWGQVVLDSEGKLKRLIGVCQDVTDTRRAEERLRKSEDRNRRIVETAEEGVWLIDQDAVTLFVNRKTADMLGYAVEDMVGKDAFSFVAPEFQGIVRARFAERERGRRERMELAFRRRTGEKLWISVAASPIFDDRGRFTGSLGMLSDITERRRNEVLLSAQRDIFSLLVAGKPLRDALMVLVQAIESLVEGVFASVLLLDEEGKRLWTGASPSLPESYNQAIHGSLIGPTAGSCGSAAFWREPIIVSDTYDDPLWSDYRELARTHGLRACWSTPIFSRDGRVLGTFAMYFREVRHPRDTELHLVKDATSASALSIEHVRNRDKLAKTISLLHATIESTADGILVVDRQGVIRNYNERFAEMWRIPREILMSRADDRALSSVLDQLSDPRGFVSRVRELYSNATLESFDILELKDGRTFERYSKPQRLDGKVVGRVWSFHDVTKRKQAEQEARRAIGIRDDFISIASHELKTPLTPLRMQVQLLKRFLAAPERLAPENVKKAEALLTDSEQQVERLLKLVDNLLDVSRIRSGKLLLSKSEFDLGEAVHGIVRHLATDFAAANCRPILSIEKGVVGLWDRARVEQVAANLITNALKYGRAKPITIRVSRSGSNAVLSVTDQGIGIAPSDQDRIFDRFERASALNSYGGLGLGLYISRQIVSGHGGTISVRSLPGRGATFEVTLPIRP